MMCSVFLGQWGAEGTDRCAVGDLETRHQGGELGRAAAELAW